MTAGPARTARSRRKSSFVPNKFFHRPPRRLFLGVAGYPPAGTAPRVTTQASATARGAWPERPSVRGLLHLWRVRGLRRLVLVRMLSSFGDGALQGALAVSVLFNPEHQTQPAGIAAGFALLLLPYSVIGPFAGALLDRWSRRRVIMWASVIRAGLVGLVALQLASGSPTGILFGTALLIMGLGRFVGSGLSASLPHTVAPDSLVGANSLATTAGAVCTALGGGYAIVTRGLLGQSNGPTATVTASVVLFYLTAAVITAKFNPRELGPNETDEAARPVRAILQGFTSALHHIRRRPTIGFAITVVMAVRFGFGLCTLIVLLLFRNYFTVSTPLLRTGATGIGEVLGVGAVGVLAGAVITAPVVRRIGSTRYVTYLLTVTAVLVLGFGSQFTTWSTLLTTFVVAYAFQSSKVCMDSVIQAEADDAYLGRVVALYDTANNICYVLAFAVGVLILPATGKSVAAVFVVTALFLITAVVYPLALSRSVRSAAGAASLAHAGTSGTTSRT